MPELPEVETVAQELDHKLKGKTVKSVSVLLGKIVSLGPGTVSNLRTTTQKQVDKFVSLVKKQKISSVSRRAKIIIFDFQGPLAILVHLKMTGQFIYLKKEELGRKVRIINKSTAPQVSLPCKFTHVIFTFTDDSKLFYNDVRQFGYLKLISDAELPHVKELREFGPEPLSSKFTYPVFESILAKRPKMKIKQFLTEPKLIAGIGNIYSDEILFRSGIKPSRVVRSLKPREKRSLFSAIPNILKKGIATKGSSVGDFIRTDGSWGTMGKHHFVYLRSGKPCKVCGTLIKSEKFGGRTGSFCPHCQK